MNLENRRIMLLVPNLEHGGSERQAVLLALTLRRKQQDVAVAIFHGGGSFATELMRAGVPLFPLGGQGWAGPFFALPNLIRLLRQQRINVLYSFLPPANVLASLAGMLTPRCRVVWSVRSVDMPLAGYGLKTRLAYALEHRLARLPGRIIVNSLAGLEACLHRGLPRQQLSVVHNGFDIELFRPDPQARLRLRAEFGLNSDEIAIGLPARLDPVKDHPTFLRAAALLYHERKNARFVCIGGAGPTNYLPELRALANSLGISDRMVWTGNRKDMPAVLNAVDIATLCSVSEGFPNTVGEAMACGLPCVVTDVGDAGFLVGDTGYVVPKRDPGALAKAWGSLFDSAIRIRLGQAARDRIVNNFSLDRLADETMAALADLA